MRIFVLIAFLCASAVPTPVFASSIDQMTVSVPACSGLAGRVDVTVNLTSATVWTTRETIVGGVSGSSGGGQWSGGPGAQTKALQYLPGTVPAGTLITFLVNLYVDNSLAVLLDTEEITFYCDTGELYVPPSMPVTTLPGFLLFGLSGLLALFGVFSVRASK